MINIYVSSFTSAKKHLFLVIIFLFLNACSKKKTGSYQQLINQAEFFYSGGKYFESAKTYREAFEDFSKSANDVDRFNAACSWALSGNDKEAFSLLKFISKHDFQNYDDIISENDLLSLHEDKRWDSLLSTIKSNIRKTQKNINFELINQLDTIYKTDQEYRLKIQSQGYKENDIKSFQKVIHKSDSINLKKVRRILDNYGWLGKDVIGKQGSKTLFLIIQHASLEVEEHYLPLLKQSVNNKKASPQHLAYLEDRIAIYKGNKQIYGTQIGRNEKTMEFYVLPLEDPENIDKRRSSIGLEPFGEYLSSFQLNWNAKKYIQDLPMLIKMQKEE